MTPLLSTLCGGVPTLASPCTRCLRADAMQTRGAPRSQPIEVANHIVGSAYLVADLSTTELPTDTAPATPSGQL